MFIAYVVVAILAAAANSFSAYMDLVRHERVAAVMDRGRVPRSWMIPLGVLKAAGALGLLVGFAVPLIGTAASAGSSCSSSAPWSSTSGRATTSSATWPCSSSWPWPRWRWAWPTGGRGERDSRPTPRWPPAGPSRDIAADAGGQRQRG
jgi:hypothetical protein